MNASLVPAEPYSAGGPTPETGAGSLVPIGRTDASLGRADLILAREGFAMFINGTVVRHDQMGAFADQKILDDLNAALAQSPNFTDEGDRIDHNTIADYICFIRMKYSGWDGMQHMFNATEFQCMPGIWSTLETGNYIILRCKYINNFPLTFIAPLKA